MPAARAQTVRAYRQKRPQTLAVEVTEPAGRPRREAGDERSQLHPSQLMYHTCRFRAAQGFVIWTATKV